MNRYLLDSNVLLHLVNRASGYQLIEQKLLSKTKRQLAVSAITVWEIFRMAEKAKVPTKASRTALELLSAFRVIALSPSAAARGGQLHGALSNMGLSIGERDSMIAAIALDHDYILVTDNVREFSRVPQLVVENWRVPSEF